MQKSIPNSYLLFNKPSGITSFDALQPVKRALGSGKVGHTGTLDKFANGLLVLLTGRALKLSDYFMHCDKKYESLICFGKETDTLDPQGTVINEAPPPTLNDIQAAIPNFKGSILQMPPIYSALHVGGKRSSDIVRCGGTVELKERPVTIYSIELVDYVPPFARINVHCSSGTYIRSLARDIGKLAGSCACLEQLQRTQVGGFLLQDALPLPFTPCELQNALQPVTPEVFTKLGIACIEIETGNEACAIRNGKPLYQIPLLTAQPKTEKENTAALFFEGEFIAVIKKDACGNWHYGFVNN